MVAIRHISSDQITFIWIRLNKLEAFLSKLHTNNIATTDRQMPLVSDIKSVLEEVAGND